MDHHFAEQGTRYNQTSNAEYEEPCKLKAVGLADAPIGNQTVGYGEFKEKLQRSEIG